MKVYIKGGGAVLDNLNSVSTSDALSANMGRLLNENKLDVAGGIMDGLLDMNGNALLTEHSITSSNGNSYDAYPTGISYSTITGDNYVQTTGQNFPYATAIVQTINIDAWRFSQLLFSSGSAIIIYIRQYRGDTFTDWTQVTMDFPIGIQNGGTGAATAADARSNLEAAAASHAHSAADVTSGTLPVDRGGTGATTAAGARSNLEVLRLKKYTYDLTNVTIAGNATLEITSAVGQSNMIGAPIIYNYGSTHPIIFSGYSGSSFHLFNTRTTSFTFSPYSANVSFWAVD